MKARIGWIVWEYEFDRQAQFYTTQPESWYYKIVKVVYFEVEDEE